MKLRSNAHRIGHLVSYIVATAMVIDGLVCLARPDLLAIEMVAVGWSEQSILIIGLVALGSGVVYALPKTSVLGAILISAFAGGAIAAHIRVSSQFVPPEAIGAFLLAGAWGGIWLRDSRLRSVLPFR